ARGEPLHDVFARLRPGRTVDIRDIGRPTARDLVDDVDRIAAAKKVLRPALAPVRRADPAAAGLAAAMNHDDRIWMRLALRNLVFDERLSHHRHVALALAVLAADVEIALFGDHQGFVSRAGYGDGQQRQRYQ